MGALLGRMFSNNPIKTNPVWARQWRAFQSNRRGYWLQPSHDVHAPARGREGDD